MWGTQVWRAQMWRTQSFIFAPHFVLALSLSSCYKVPSSGPPPHFLCWGQASTAYCPDGRSQNSLPVTWFYNILEGVGGHDHVLVLCVQINSKALNSKPFHILSLSSFHSPEDSDWWVNGLHRWCSTPWERKHLSAAVPTVPYVGCSLCRKSISAEQPCCQERPGHPASLAYCAGGAEF